MSTIKEKLSAIRAGVISHHAKILEATPKPLKPLVREIGLIAWGYAMLIGMGVYITVALSMGSTDIEQDRTEIHKLLEDPMRAGLKPGECVFLPQEKRPARFFRLPESSAMTGFKLAASFGIVRPFSQEYNLGLMPVFKIASCKAAGLGTPIPPAKVAAAVNDALNRFMDSKDFAETRKTIPPHSQGFFRLDPPKPIYPFPWQWFNNGS